MKAHVRVTGWREGAKKISANYALRRHAPLGLKEAKKVVDDVLVGETVTLPAIERKQAVQPVGELRHLNFEAEIES